MKEPIYMTWEEIEEMIRKQVMEEVMSLVETDDQGRLWINDKKNNRRFEITDDMLRISASDQKVIKKASEMSLQKKQERLVINLPAWLKDRLKNKAKQTGKSMNEIIRLALTEYLAK